MTDSTRATARLFARWQSDDPEAQAKALLAELDRADAAFFEVRADTEVPERRRCDDPEKVLVGRHFGEENPTFKVGWTERGIVLVGDFPPLDAIRQRRHGFFRPEWESYTVGDHEREDRWRRIVAECASRVGLDHAAAHTEWTVVG